MTILGWTGNPRQGKTLGMIYYFYRQHLKGRKVYSYKMNTKFSETINVNDILSFDIDKGDLMLDEVHTLIDSRNSNQLSRLLSYFWTQSGKRELNLGYTTQIGGMVDLRLREIADRVWDCHKVYKIDRLHKVKYVSKFRYIRNIDDEMIGTPKTIPVQKARKLYHLYDTYQKILPVELDASDVISFGVIKNIFANSPTKRAFQSIISAKYAHMKYDNIGAVYDCLKNNMEKEAKEILRIR